MWTLALVRHGETVGNSSIRYFGRTDVELSEPGRAQMRAARRWLQHRFGSSKFSSVIASPLRRAAEGAAIIAGTDRAIVEIEEFVEVDFGRFEGLTADEISERYPTEFARWNRDRLNPGFTYPDGESRTEFARRVERGIQRMLEVVDRAVLPEVGAAVTDGDVAADAEDGAVTSGNGVALVVAHRGVIRIIANRLAGVEPAIALGSIHILRRDGLADTWRADAIDIVEHLAELD